VQSAQPEPREQVTAMLSPESDKDFELSLPDSTAQPTATDEKPKRKRRTKEEMASARGEGESSEVVIDKDLERARRKYTVLGAGSTIKAGFVTMRKPLSKSEEEDVDDYFRLVSSKGGLDPAQSWVTMFFCALLLLCRLVFVRTDLGEQLKGFLFPEPKKEETPDAEAS
jgi:hypothetical protein